MLYLCENDIKEIGIDWNNTIRMIEDTVKCIQNNDFNQPIKPYLRYRDLKNRIIAMPAFVGGDINVSGIKWIASFPDNINIGKARANSVTILNNAETGEVISIINTTLLSIIRTASVSGLMMNYYHNIKRNKEFKLGILGWGPIGKYHFDMFNNLYHNNIEKIYLYDIKGIDPQTINKNVIDKVKIVDNWMDVYKNSDVLTTCTVADKPYIQGTPKTGSLLLNVSLRDYHVSIYDDVKNRIIVDDWEEVCRENTDIERMYKLKGLTKEETFSITDVVCKNVFESFQEEDVIMFNPMGMAVFDIAIGQYYFNKAKEKECGKNLN